MPDDELRQVGVPAFLHDPGSIEATPERLHLHRLADGVRLVIDRLTSTRAPLEALERAAELVEEIGELLDRHPHDRPFEAFAEAANAGTARGFFDHSPLMGRANPLAPPLTLQVVDDHVEGWGTFGSAYEGPPGSVHGGYVAAAFDEVLGLTQSLSGRPGMTGTLVVRYRKPTPLHVDLRFEGRLLRVEGRKIFTEGTVCHGDQLTAEAEAIFVSVDITRIAKLLADREQRGR